MALDRLQPQIEAFYNESSMKGAWSGISKDITSAWLNQGLQARSITRDMRWGTEVPLPGYEEKVIYPWFDACIGYVSITASYTEDWEKWWRRPDDVDLFQFLGKDNVVFHSVVFPGTQIGSHNVWTKLHHLSATEYLTYEGGKFSKSRGVGVFGDSAQLTGVPADSWRFYLLSQRPESSDSEFNWDSLISSNNNLLLKNLGNFVNRTMKFLNSRHFERIVPDYTEYHEASFDVLKDEVNVLVSQYIQELDAVKLRAGSATIMQISSKGNAFLQSNGLDNKLAESNRPKCAAVIGLAVNLIHLLAALMSPYIPDSAQSINAMLHADQLLIPEHWTPDSIKPGHKVGEARLLFASIKSEKAEEWRRLFGDEEARKLKEEESLKKNKKKAFAKAQKSSK